MPVSPSATSSPKPPPTELALAWKAAQKALLDFKAKRDPTHREIAAARLYEVALREADIIVKKKVDTDLPPSKQRDKAEMASNAVSSVLTNKRLRMTVLTDYFDPDRGSLRTLMATILYNKVMDYVRRERIPGVIGRRATPSAATGAGPRQEDDGQDALSSIAAFTQTLLPDAPPPPPRTASTLATPMDGSDNSAGWGAAAARGGQAPDSHQDDHETPQILGALTRFLSEDEAEVFVCEFHEMTRAEGLAYLNEQHGPRLGADGKLHPYMSLATYNRKLKQAQDKLAKLFPDHRP